MSGVSSLLNELWALGAGVFITPFYEFGRLMADLGIGGSWEIALVAMVISAVLGVAGFWSDSLIQNSRFQLCAAVVSFCAAGFWFVIIKTDPNWLLPVLMTGSWAFVGFTQGGHALSLLNEKREK